MGASWSQKNNATEPNHSTTKFSSHQNESKDVMKHDNSPVERSSSKKQQVEQDHNAKEDPPVQKSGVGTEPKPVSLSARDLSITWGEDNRYWHWLPLKDSNDKNFEAAELLNVCWLEVQGKFDTAKLRAGIVYEVVFVVRLTHHAYGWQFPVTLRLTLPDGRKQESKEDFTTKQKEEWIEIRAGVFETTAENIGEIEFSLNGGEGGIWKRGLIIKGVNFKPKA